MKADSEGLHKIANTDKSGRRADMVFIHGLGGASHSTWRHGKEGRPDHFFWPDELGKQLKDFGIWSVGYPAGFTGLGKQGMIIEKRAGNVSDTLANGGLGDRPILFITHSMGGLIVKHLIVDSQMLPGEDRKRIVSCIRGIVFCGTPHRGAAFADAAHVFGLLGGGSQTHVDEMRANAEKLDLLHDKFIEWHRQHPVPIESYAENQKLMLTHWFFFATDYGVVVPRASANPGIAGCEIHDSDDDHLTLVKPRDAQHNVYAGVSRFIEKALKPASPPTPPTVATPTLAPAHVVIETPPAKAAEIPTDISRILKYAPAQLIGREEETKLLNDAWAKTQNHDPKRPHVLTFVALGGEGKTSLVAKWAAELAGQDWPGCDAAFAWSFYSQGTREQLAASSDLFLKAALAFFGDDADKAFAASPAGTFEKGQRLARLVGQRRSLLILDGLEPLQYAPTAPTPGELKDQGLAALLKGLTAASHGLCVVTTRYSLPDLRAFWQTTAPEVKLLRLSRNAGVHLLKTLGVKGSELRNIPSSDGKEQLNEFEKLVEDVKGHALTLTLLGGFLKRAFHGDIRQRDRVKFEKADEKMDGGHAFRTMAAYEQWLLSGGDEGRREVAVLRLMGLFDRPADAGCLAALRREPIPGLTEPLAGLADDDWEYCLSGLETAKLLTVNRDAAGALVSLDAHPLLREYFARQLREQQPDAWRAAHRRLYEHLRATTKEGDQPTLEDLQPLYQAVAHGCQAGLQPEALCKVYFVRILRQNEHYSWRKLGAFGSDLGAVACFFEQPWNRLSSTLVDGNQTFVMNQTALYLMALGRPTEALTLMRAALVNFEAQTISERLSVFASPEQVQNSKMYNAFIGAAKIASNLSVLELTLGAVAKAVEDAKLSVDHADAIGVADLREMAHAKMALALHQAGRREDSQALFREAEQMQAEREPDYPLLYSLHSFWYCDLLLTEAERAAWQLVQKSEVRCQRSELLEECRAVSQRAAQTLKWEGGRLLDIALDNLTLGRAALYRVILENSDFRLLTSDLSHIGAAMNGLRRAGTQDHLPLGLLTRAWLRFLAGDAAGAWADLDEAWEIAERGSMKLFMADIHLSRARLFGRLKAEGEMLKYPWGSPQADLAAAEKLINECGYHRRDEELADAKKAILS
ncbi:MAG: hypothetical protein WCV00_19950 [Verrucomicrobiia bacterium]